MTYDFSAISSGIDAYFAECDSKNEGAKEGKILKPYTLSGLICHLGLGKNEYHKLCQKKKYAHLFDAARARIEAFTEEYALTGALSASAAANTLKYNFGWFEAPMTGTEPDTQKTVKLILDGDLVRLGE